LLTFWKRVAQKRNRSWLGNAIRTLRGSSGVGVGGADALAGPATFGGSGKR
jgi:hypothetical protein